VWRSVFIGKKIADKKRGEPNVPWIVKYNVGGMIELKESIHTDTHNRFNKKKTDAYYTY